MNKRKNGKKLLLFCVILILVLGLIFGGLQLLESTVFTPAPVETEKPHSLTVTRDGVDYFPRQDITVIMALGIDELGPVKSSGGYRNNGEADAIVLLILDHADESYTLLCLNRDMMVKMPALGPGGRPAGSYYGQLALSHTYGEGLADSCENTRNTVSNLFNGIQIDHYVAMNMEGISILNDAVGGVMAKYKIPQENLLVIYDDYDLPKGKVRIRASGSAGTHNGMRSIIGETGLKDFARIRIGIRDENVDIPIVNYVLSDIKKDDYPLFADACKKAGEAAVAFAKGEPIDKVMCRFN